MDTEERHRLLLVCAGVRFGCGVPREALSTKIGCRGRRIRCIRVARNRIRTAVEEAGANRSASRASGCGPSLGVFGVERPGNPEAVTEVKRSIRIPVCGSRGLPSGKKGRGCDYCRSCEPGEPDSQRPYDVRALCGACPGGEVR